MVVELVQHLDAAAVAQLPVGDVSLPALVGHLEQNRTIELLAACGLGVTNPRRFRIRQIVARLGTTRPAHRGGRRWWRRPRQALAPNYFRSRTTSSSTLAGSRPGSSAVGGPALAGGSPSSSKRRHSSCTTDRQAGSAATALLERPSTTTAVMTTLASDTLHLPPRGANYDADTCERCAEIGHCLGRCVPGALAGKRLTHPPVVERVSKTCVAMGSLRPPGQPARSPGASPRPAGREPPMTAVRVSAGPHDHGRSITRTTGS